MGTHPPPQVISSLQHPTRRRGRATRPPGSVASLTSWCGSGVHHAVAEPPFVQQLQLQADFVGEGLLATAHHNRCEEQVALVDQPGFEGLGRQVGTAHGEVMSPCRLSCRTASGSKSRSIRVLVRQSEIVMGARVPARNAGQPTGPLSWQAAPPTGGGLLIGGAAATAAS
jgi:hypothetical protein